MPKCPITNQDGIPPQVHQHVDINGDDVRSNTPWNGATDISRRSGIVRTVHGLLYASDRIPGGRPICTHMAYVPRRLDGVEPLSLRSIPHQSNHIRSPILAWDANHWPDPDGSSMSLSHLHFQINSHRLTPHHPAASSNTSPSPPAHHPPHTPPFQSQFHPPLSIHASDTIPALSARLL